MWRRAVENGVRWCLKGAGGSGVGARMGKLATFGLSFFGIVYVSGKYAFPAPGGGGGGLWPERRRKELLLKPQVDNPGLKKGGAIFYPLFTIF